jgi:hypothetical protein
VLLKDEIQGEATNNEEDLIQLSLYITTFFAKAVRHVSHRASMGL